jgi:sugar phosphate permease
MEQNRRGWLVIVCGGLFYLYQFMLRVSPNIMNEELMARLSVDGAALGAVIGVYYWSYVGMQLPLGITIDRLGPRSFLCGSSFLCAFSCYLFGNTTDMYVAAFARFLMGMGSACGLIGTIKLGTIWLEPKHIAKVTAITILMGTVGASLGGTPLKLLLINSSLEITMEYLSYLGALIGTIIYFVVHNNPKLDHHTEVQDLYGNEHPIKDIKKIIRKPQIWVIAIYGMLMYIPITVIGTAWGVSFVERACSTTEAVAASVVSSMFLGAAIGSPIFAIASDYLKSRRLPMLIGSIITASIWFSIIVIENIPLSIMYVLFFIAGFAYTAKCLTFASICEIMPNKMSGISLAFSNMIVMTTGIIFHPLIGALLDFSWDGHKVNDVYYYSEMDYRFALLVIPVFLTLSCINLFFIKETHPDSAISKTYGPIIDTDPL